MDAETYARTYGPSTGDLIRLGDTSLLAEVEQDLCIGGYELTGGAGKTMRDGEGLSPRITPKTGALDTVIQSAIIIDANLGIIKADIGIKNGRIVGVGKAGNPDVMPGVDRRLVVGSGTAIVAGHRYIVTAGAVEAHGHLVSPDHTEHSLAAGITTIVGAASPSSAIDAGSGSHHLIKQFIRGAEQSPLNFALLVRASSDQRAVEESVAGGGVGVKVHEDFSASPAVIDASLCAAERHDFPVHIHTDSINEFGFAEDTLAAIGDRTIHMYHVEGAGGGHAPDLLRVVSMPNVIPSSTNPTNPFTPAALEEGLPMTMIGHNLDPYSPEDVAFADARIRPQTMSAEDYLHDIGAISIFGTDSQGMGRLAENTAKCWQLASTMKDRYGWLAHERTALADNERIKRYIAKLTINPAIAVGIDQHVGAIMPGRMADLVLWPFASFGIKPAYVMKSGIISWASMGDGNGSLWMSEPIVQRRMWGALGAAPGVLGAIFVSRLAASGDQADRLATNKPILPITSTRALRKQDMVHNDALPDVSVDPRTFDVSVDGNRLETHSVTSVPLNRRYLLR